MIVYKTFVLSKVLLLSTAHSQQIARPPPSPLLNLYYFLLLLLFSNACQINRKRQTDGCNDNQDNGNSAAQRAKEYPGTRPQSQCYS